MLCACSSGEQFRFEEPPPKSPESLATRDFSVGGISSRTGDLKSLSSRTNGDLGSKYEDAHVDEVESTLKEALSLNYEEARALLGRIEYQKGNLDAAVQLFQGIDIKGLTPRMTTAIFKRSRRKKMRSKGDDSLTGVMSWHSVSLFLEAILLKAKVYKELGRIKDAAKECKIILDIVESALPNGMPEGIGQDPKMQEMFHKALELLPKLWKQAGCIDEAITSYRRALIRPWNLDSERLAAVQKELASTLLYGGVETSLPSTLDPLTPTNNLEEAILLLFILMGKIAKMEITWDPEIMDHLTFALSVCGGFEFLADHIEQALPGFYSRAERWYILALCYSSSGQNDVALDLIKKAMGHSELNHKPHIPSCLFGAKLCAQDEKHARDGIRFSQMFIELASDEHAHLVGQARKFLGICYANAARTTMSKYERAMYQNECLDALDRAFSKDNEDPDLLFRIGLENAVQRNLEDAFEYVMRYSDEVAGSSVEGWKLLALVQSARERLSGAETLVEVALKEVTGTDQLELLKLKAVIQITSEEPRQAMETYGLLLAHIQAAKDAMTNLEAPALKQIEIEAWQDLAKMYTKFRSWRDAEICIDKARALEFYNPQSWHAAGSLFKQRSLQKQAMVAYSIALSIDPTYVPSIVGAAQVLTELGLHSHPIARSMLMNALQYDPVNYDAWLSLGSISNQEGLTELAAECFQAAVEVHSTRPVLPFR